MSHKVELSYRKGRVIAAYVTFQTDRRVDRSETAGSGLVLDYDVRGKLVGIEVSALPDNFSIGTASIEKP